MSVYDAIIIGAGPGGSTAGCTLARAGKKVLIIEREKFPRFHIGESLIPFGNDELREIGIWDKLESSGFMPKLGAEFVLGNTKASTGILFGRFLKQQHSRTFQVERARFDQLLMEHAEEAGCEIWQQTKVESVCISDNQATITCSREGKKVVLSARWLLDASGRDAFLGKALRIPRTDLGLPKKIATFAHFRGVRRNEAPKHGHITIVRMAHGWSWLIPLDEEKTSVGLVQTVESFQASGLTPEEQFEKLVHETTALRERLENAERVGDYASAGDYTYRYLENAGPCWLMIGDAAGFIDPIFSSGVMIAVKSGHMAARQVLAADSTGGVLSQKARQKYTRDVGKMCGVFLRMIKMFYDNRSFEVFMSPSPWVEIERAVNNLCAGHTRMPLHLRLKVRLFYFLCSVQRHLPIVPRLDLAD